MVGRCQGGGSPHEESISRLGKGSPWQCARTASSKKANTERPCWTQVVATVHSRSHQCCPFSPRVPWVIRRCMATKRIACSARLFVVLLLPFYPSGLPRRGCNL